MFLYIHKNLQTLLLIETGICLRLELHLKMHCENLRCAGTGGSRSLYLWHDDVFLTKGVKQGALQRVKPWQSLVDAAGNYDVTS